MSQLATVAHVPDAPIVKQEELNRYLSNPVWDAEMQEAAQTLLDDLTDSLARALWGSRIVPSPFAERAPIIARTGQVITRYPVFSVTELEGDPITALPSGWQLDRHRLYQVNTGSNAGFNFLQTGWGGFGNTPVQGEYSGWVTLGYQAGWGPEPALKLAILRKGKALFLNNNDDTLIARGTSADPPQPLPNEDWTAAELDPLGTFRRIGLP
jgi:hypothetical protein